MPTIRRVIAYATASLLLAACGDDSSSKMPVNLIIDSGTDGGGQDAGEPEACPAGDADVSITDTTLEGSMLTLQLEFGGGCKEHSFSVGWGGAVGTSDPPHIPLEINHYGNGDSCEALLSRSIVIDLSSIDGVRPPTWIDLIGSRGKAIVGATAILYEGPKQGEVIVDEALKVRRECAHATF